MPYFVGTEIPTICWRQHEFNVEALDGRIEKIDNDLPCYVVAHHPNKNWSYNVGIINAARGGIIHEEDLDKALNENLIFGAGIDVFKKEPPENNNPLLKNEKVYLSPHTAAFTDECMTRMGKETIQNIIDFFEEKLEKSKIVKL